MVSENNELNIQTYIQELKDDQTAIDDMSANISKTKDFQELHNKKIKKRGHRHQKGEPKKGKLDRGEHEEWVIKPARKRAKQDAHTEKKQQRNTEIPITDTFDPDIPISNQEYEKYRINQSDNFDSKPLKSGTTTTSSTDQTTNQREEQFKYWERQIKDTRR